ncbi:MAG TPA: sugar ABC transporter permease [Chloroflexota bacterium]|nr:sugar ABC transporter permease [Chloroflexota bacterium]
MSVRTAVARRARRVRYRELTARQKEWVLGYAMLVPAFFFIIGLIAYPATWAIYLSFTDKVIGQVEHFTGLANLQWLARWPDFGQMILNTVLLAVVGVSIKAFVGMTMALALNEQFVGRTIVRALLFLPWTVPSFVAGLIWRWLYDDQNGLFNWFLLNLGLIDSPISWLGDVRWAMPAVLSVVVWKGFPFFGIAYLAGMQAIPSEQYEAAEVDGASALQRFRHITLPGLRHVMLVTVMLSLIWTANTFDIVFIMTRGGPSNATEVFTMLIYDQGIRNGRIGEASTAALMAMPVFASLIVLLTRYLQDRGEETS